MYHFCVVGLMGCVSSDDILIKYDGVAIQQFGPGLTVEYNQYFRRELFHCLGNMNEPTPNYIAREATTFRYDALQHILSKNKVKPEQRFFHSQIVGHKPNYDKTI